MNSSCRMALLARCRRIGRENGTEGIEAYCQAKSVLMPFGYTPE